MATQEGYYVIRTWEAGLMGEKIKFFVPGKRPEGTLSRRQKSAIRKAEQNAYSAQKSLARKIHANFPGGGLFLGLDYSEAGMKKLMAHARKWGYPVDSVDETERQNALWEAAARELENCLRRVRGRLKKQGKELKAIYSTSDMDGDTGELVRVHHHLIVNQDVEHAFREAWEKAGYGGVEWEQLWENQIDRTRLAEYIIKQLRRIPDAKKIRSTKNLIQPKMKDRIVHTDRELQPPKGCKLVYRQEYQNNGDYNWENDNRQPQYIRYILVKKLDAAGKAASGTGK